MLLTAREKVNFRRGKRYPMFEFDYLSPDDMIFYKASLFLDDDWSRNRLYAAYERVRNHAR